MGRFVSPFIKFILGVIMSTQITALDFEILKLKAMLSDTLLEQKGLQTRLNMLNDNEKNLIQKIDFSMKIARGIKRL